MTQWVRSTGGGRERGPRGLLRAWVGILVAPAAFFRANVRPGDQAPGLVFAMAVVAVAAGTHLALVPAARPSVTGGRAVDALLAWVVVVLLLAPLALHLVAALQTVLLVALAPERGGVSETVQVLAYATAPCALAGLPSPAVRLLACGYGAALLVVGLRVRHGTSLLRTVLVAALPAALVFGYAFGAFAAAATLASRFAL